MDGMILMLIGVVLMVMAIGAGLYILGHAAMFGCFPWETEDWS